MRLRRLPLKGAHPVARQSRFHGCPRADSPCSSGSGVAGYAMAWWST